VRHHRVPFGLHTFSETSFSGIVLFSSVRSHSLDAGWSDPLLLCLISLDNHFPIAGRRASVFLCLWDLCDRAVSYVSQCEQLFCSMQSPEWKGK